MIENKKIDKLLDSISLKSVNTDCDLSDKIIEKIYNKDFTKTNHQILKQVTVIILLVASIVAGYLIGFRSDVSSYTREEKLDVLSSEYYSDISEKDMNSIK